MAKPTLTAKTHPGDVLITAGVKEAYFTLTMGTTYSTGGHTATLGTYFSTEVYGMELVAGIAKAAYGVQLGYVRGTDGDPDTGKIVAYYIGSVLTSVPELFTECSASKDLHTIQGIVKFVGR